MVIIIIITFILIKELGFTGSLLSWKALTGPSSAQLPLYVITQTLETVNVDLELDYLHRGGAHFYMSTGIDFLCNIASNRRYFTILQLYLNVFMFHVESLWNSQSSLRIFLKKIFFIRLPWKTKSKRRVRTSQKSVFLLNSKVTALLNAT